MKRNRRRATSVRVGLLADERELIRQPATPRNSDRQHFWLGLAGLLLLVVAVYGSTINNGFIWDDETYVENNPTLTSIGGLYDIWFRIGAVPQYYPLVHTTFWVENRLWGLNPSGFHLVNLLLHAAAAALLWRLLVDLQLPGAWLAAAIFVVHPVHVETVAWITERKNVLSCLLALASLWAYIRFSPPSAAIESTSKSGGLRERWPFYGLSFVLYVLALLSKTVACSLPAVLLLIYWWKRGRLEGRELVRLLPFFAVGLLMAGVTVFMERTRVRAVGEEWDLSPIERVLIAGRAVWFYAGKLAWPRPLIFFYPRWDIDSAQWRQYLYPVAALALIALLWVLRLRSGRGLLTAVLIFVGVLLPALGFFNVYPFRFSFVADHFQYHASIALIALFAAGVALSARRLAPRWGLPLAAVVILAPAAIWAQQRTSVYRGLESLYEDTISQNPTCWVAYHNLAIYQEGRGLRREAIENYRRAVELDPKQARLRVSLGVALFLSRELDEAASQLTQALACRPDLSEQNTALTYLGNIWTVQRRYDEAFAAFRAASSADPSNAATLCFLAVAQDERGDTAAAIETLREALRRDSEYPAALNLLGKMLCAQARVADAVAPLTKAVQLSPDHAAYRSDLGLTLFQVGELTAAEVQLRVAVDLDPGNVQAHNALGAILGSRDDLTGAIAQFQAALAIDPDNADARRNLERALQAQRRSTR